MSFQSLLVSAADAPGLLVRCREALAGSRGQHNLGVLYLSDHVAADAAGVVEGLRLVTGVEHWVVGTAVGVLGTEGDAFDAPALSLLLASLPAGAFRVFGPVQVAGEDADLARWRGRCSPHLGLVHADPRHPAVQGLLAELCAGGSTYLVGGLLSSRGACYQHGATGGEGAVSGVLFSGGVTVATRLSQGCSPIGPRHTVSRADGPRLLELDGRPALEVLAEDLERDGGGAADVHVALPRRGSDTGDYLVRNLMGVDADSRGLVVGEQLQAGAALMFCRRNAEAARRDLERMLDELAGTLAGTARAGVYVSCLARGPNLFREPGLEMRLIRERFGAIPLTGFYANGEIAGEELYGYTGVLTLFV